MYGNMVTNKKDLLRIKRFSCFLAKINNTIRLKYQWFERQKVFFYQLIILSLASLSACVYNANHSEQDSLQQTKVEILAAWIQIPDTQKSSGKWIARVIVNGLKGEAPIVLVDGLQSNAVYLRGQNGDPQHFPVRVYELGFSPQSSLKIKRSSLDPNPIMFDFLPYDVSTLGNQILLVADSGCRGAGNQTNCQQDFPFPQIAKNNASKLTPSVVIHLGDYLYRQNYQNGYCNQGDPCDTWENWANDFFNSAKPLFAKAPWVFSRGNHEQCGWRTQTGKSNGPYTYGGRGWFMFLDPFSAALDNDLIGCKEQNSQAVFDPAFSIDLPFQVAGGKQKILRLFMLDSARNHHRDYKNDFKVFENLIDSSIDDYWLVTHQPPIAVTSIDSMNGSYVPNVEYSNTYILDAYASNHSVVSKVSLVLSGHIHLGYQALIPQENYAPQVIVGNTGVNYKGRPSAQDNCYFSGKANTQSNPYFPDDFNLQGVFYRLHGAALITATNNAKSIWDIQFNDQKAKTEYACSVLEVKNGMAPSTLSCKKGSLETCTS